MFRDDAATDDVHMPGGCAAAPVHCLQRWLRRKQPPTGGRQGAATRSDAEVAATVDARDTLRIATLHLLWVESWHDLPDSQSSGDGVAKQLRYPP
jgi:hypothetical protein